MPEAKAAAGRRAAKPAKPPERLGLLRRVGRAIVRGARRVGRAVVGAST